MSSYSSMDQHREYTSWSYDNSVPPPPYHDAGNFNHGGGFSNSGHYNHHRRYHNPHQSFPTEPNDSFGYVNGTAFAGRKRQFSHSASGPPEYIDGVGHVKLYVRGVPREVTEHDIRSLFGNHGNVIEVILFKEIKNLQEQECCFVKYANVEDADQAIRALHNQHTFPGGMRPIEVKYASRKQERPGTGCSRTHECKVFVGCLNKQASKMEIADIFLPYGYVEEVFLLRDEQRQNRGLGFITFSHKHMATAAINALNGNYVMKGCDQPLIVRFADPKKPKTGETRSAPYVGDPVGQTSVPNGSHMSWQTGSEPPSVSSTCSVPTSTERAEPPDCDWSEHICPDGHSYYYNCVTCESRWEKPEEYSFYEQQVDNYHHQPPNPPWHSQVSSVKDVPQQLQPQT